MPHGAIITTKLKTISSSSNFVWVWEFNAPGLENNLNLYTLLNSPNVWFVYDKNWSKINVKEFIDKDTLWELHFYSGWEIISSTSSIQNS